MSVEDAVWWLALAVFALAVVPAVVVVCLLRTGARCGSDLLGSVLCSLHF